MLRANIIVIFKLNCWYFDLSEVVVCLIKWGVLIYLNIIGIPIHPPFDFPFDDQYLKSQANLFIIFKGSVLYL